jgi:hypothetical protein
VTPARGAAPTEREPTPLPPPAEPAPARPQPPLAPVRAPAAAVERCRIKFHSNATKAHFFAVAYDGGQVIARSAYFKVRRAEDEPGLSPPEALRGLVDELTAAGWRQTGTGRVPWDLRFQRGRPAP